MKKYTEKQKFFSDCTDICADYKITMNQLYFLICIHMKKFDDYYKYLDQVHEKATKSIFLERLQEEEFIGCLNVGKYGMQVDMCYIIDTDLKSRISNLFDFNEEINAKITKSFNKFYETYPAVVTSDNKRLTLKAVSKSEVKRHYNNLIFEYGEEVIAQIQEGTEIALKENMINCKIITFLESEMFKDHLKSKKKSNLELDSEKFSM